MKLPPLMLLLASLFWGWQSGYLWLGLVAGLLLEGGHIRRWQHALPAAALHRVANLCALLLVAVSAGLLFSYELPQAVLAIVRWSPLMVMPLMLGVSYSGRADVPLSMISSVARWQLQQGNGGPQIDLGVPYVALWLLAAGVSNQQGPGFYLGLVAISSWVLWGIRPRERSVWPWAAALMCAAVLGAGLDWGLYRLQGVIEQGMMDWFAGDVDEDPQQTSTELGHIGQLKLSGAVVLQVQAEPALAQPLLLKTASYNYYSAPSWLVAGNRSFLRLAPDASGLRSWHLSGSPAIGQLGIATSARQSTTVLALPAGTTRIEAARLLHVSRSRLGTVQATLDAGFYHYQVNYAALAQDHSLPNEYDLSLPRGDAALLREMAQQLQLSGQPAQVILPRLKNHFAANYRYSTARGGTHPGKSALADFLQRDHRGHCEHFATASVMLLRAAGVPARYAVGYLVQEPNRLGNGYLVRQRHAHAWVEAYVDGVWQNFDTTPASWPTLEQGHASFWEPVQDIASWLWYQIRQWRFTQTQMLLAASLVLLIIFIRPKLRAWKRGKAQGKKPGKAQGKPARKGSATAETAPVREAAFFQIEQHLAARGMARPAHEALSHWQARIAPQLPAEAGTLLADLLRLHYRCRFGPQPVPQETLAQLREGCREWLGRFGGR